MGSGRKDVFVVKACDRGQKHGYRAKGMDAFRTKNIAPGAKNVAPGGLKRGARGQKRCARAEIFWPHDMGALEQNFSYAPMGGCVWMD